MNSRKNLLFIHCHDLGRHLGCYGVPGEFSPNIDALAGKGALFEDHFCTSPGCSPSRAALWTGRYPHRTGVLGLTHGNFLWDLNSNEKHLAEILADQGYEAVLAGGYHEARLFERLGYEHQLLPEETEIEGWAPAREISSLVEMFLDEHKNSSRPFFLSVGLFEPHRPFGFGGIVPDNRSSHWIPPYIPTETFAQSEAAQHDFAHLVAAIREVDSQIGRISRAVENCGLAETTFIVLTSDHGLAMPRAKCSLYDPGLEIPLIFVGPSSRLQEGRRQAGLTSNVDVLPTILDLLELPPISNIDGKSLLPILDGEFAHEAIFFEKTYHRTYDPIRGVRTDGWKYILNFELNTVYDPPSDIVESPIFLQSPCLYLNARPIEELYDLRADPYEMKNLALDINYETIRNAFRERLITWMQNTSDPLFEGPVRSRYDAALRQSPIFN